MKKAWNIRRMTESDVDAVYAIETSAHITPWSKNILRDCVLVGYRCLVLELQMDKSKIIGGYAICRHADNSCHLLNLCIAKELQSQGYGRIFLQELLNSLVLFKDIKNVILEVRPSNKIALHLYETMGFEQVEIKRDYYKDTEQIEDAIFLRKNLFT